MKHEYKCIKSWTFENPDGTKVEIYIGDKVRIKVNTKTVDLNHWLWGKLENPIDFRIANLTKISLEGEMILHGTTYFRLYPKDIIEITKLNIEDLTMFNDNEKRFIDILNKAKRCVKGELELDCDDDKWYAMDYREDFECAFPIEAEPYDKPIITDEEAKEKGIDIVKCCDECDISYVG